MPKRPRADSRSESTNVFFEQLFAVANAYNPNSVALSSLKEWKMHFLSLEAEKKKCIHKAAKKFTLDEAVRDFGLTYSTRMSHAEKYWWKIETLPEVKTFQPSACLVSLLEKYTAIYDRSSESACRVAVDFLLCECIGVMRGMVSGISTSEEAEDGRRTPTPWDKVKVHCEVSFKHKLPKTQTIVSGRVDHDVGIVLGANEDCKRLFYSLLLCVEAKVHNTLDDALAQLVVYLACLRQSRVSRGRSNASVYGVATDGLRYTFVTITHEGVLKASNPFNIMRGDLATVLGCLQYILEMAISMSPNLMPEKGTSDKGDVLEASDDDLIDLDDNSYLYHDDSDDSYGDEDEASDENDYYS